MKKLFYIVLFIFPFSLFGQIKNIGVPEIHNYQKSLYNAGTQNWDIAQDENDFMYFANNEGVLIFDGIYWHLIPVSKSKPIRSIFTDTNKKIYIGLLNDFGYLQPDDSVMYSFVSLRDILPGEVGEFDEVWKIFETQDGIIFQTYDYLFIIKNDEITVIKPQNRFHFAFNVGGKLFIEDSGIGIFEYKNGSLIKTGWSDVMKGMEIWEILAFEDNQLLICTDGYGIYKYAEGSLQLWDVPVNALVQKNKLYSAKKIKNNYYAFGTILDGLIISDENGEIIQHINRNNGLQNNTILSIYSDNAQNLWLGLDNGISFIEIDSPISYFTGDEGLGAGYTSRIFNGKLYLGTNQGLFVKNLDDNHQTDTEFRLVENTAGQVWSLYIFDNQLICGHNSGAFLINDERAIKISTEEGAWKFIQMDSDSDFLLAGQYNGLVLYTKANNRWSSHKKVKAFDVSCRFLEQDKYGYIWVSHGARGVYRIRLSENLDSVINYNLYTSKDGLPSPEQNIVLKLGENIIFSSEDGIYTYDYENSTFKLSEKYMDLFSTRGRLKTLEEDKSGNIWYIAQEESGVLRLNADSTYTKIYTPFNQLIGRYINEFEFIYPYNEDHIITGLYNGFAHYSSNLPKSYSKSYNSFIIKVELPYIDSSISFRQLRKEENEFVFPFKKNSFRFYYTAPYFEDLDQLEFSFYLEGFSEDWSEWSPISFKDFTNLYEGEYTFYIKARNVYEVESDVASFTFTLTPPLHRTIAAKYTYVVLSLILLFILIRVVHIRVKRSKERERIKHKEQMKKQEEEFQRQALISEKEIIRLRNEKLRTEMIHRDKELANQTMNIIQKNKLLSKLKDELDLIQKESEDTQLKTKMVVLKRRIDKEIDNKQQNQVFKTYFEEVHEKFFERLKEKHPDLSPRELHLSAYIRMNLTTKEIATLQNITSRGVEIGRYRLRKKMNLSREINLSTYLLNI